MVEISPLTSGPEGGLDAAYLAVLVGMIENLRTSATAILDHQYVHVDPSIDDVIVSPPGRRRSRSCAASTLPTRVRSS